VERISEAFGLPTRTEMDAAHRRITELERLVRRMAAVTKRSPSPAAGTPEKKPAKKAAPKPRARKAAP
jgi:hypothetical protein